MNAPSDSTKKATKLTPMMAQYLSIRAEAGPEALLFYRMGDFYELFFEDAVKAAAALDIALTKRGTHDGQPIPMCGVPVHSSETYLQRLIKKGFRVAVCEQTEDPKEAKKRGSKSVVRREIVRLVTPGTLTEDTLLDGRSRNLIACVSISLAGDAALAWADISDGLFQTQALDIADLPSALASLAPAELVLPEALYQDAPRLQAWPLDGVALTPQAKTKFDMRAGERRLKDHFNVGSLDGLGAFSKPEISAAGALLDYLELTQAGMPAELSAPRQMAAQSYLAIDPATRASLEIARTQRGQKAGSLLSVIDRTVSGPGARELSDRLNRPLLDRAAIAARHDAVSFFVTHEDLRRLVRGHLRQVGDMARAVSRLCLGRGGPRDLRVICDSLRRGEQLSADFLKSPNIEPPQNVHASLAAISLAAQTELADFARDIDKAFTADVPMLARDGGFVATGWRPEIDQLKTLRDDARRVVAGLQARYAEQTGVASLKIRHNNVIGYHVDVTPRHADGLMSAREDNPFIHRQTLKSSVRFTTTELADLDQQISGAADKVCALEVEVFEAFAARARDLSGSIRAAAQGFAGLDVQAAWAAWASETRATRPDMRDAPIIEIVGGRHPVVEAALKKDGASGFTANDLTLGDETSPRLALITGPNMAGKSTYLRQNALFIILAQSGGFVPADRAVIGIADRLFSRVGASDDLSKGRSTFMMEMIETAAILNQATPRSFVILDEIGRGTSTFDGLSIAWAAVEYLHSVNQCRALFATHYHELTELIETLDGTANFSLRAKDWEGELIFLHDVRPGAADQSYGIAVAKLAGLPAQAVARARAVLAQLEDTREGRAPIVDNLPLFSATPPRPTKRVPSLTETAIVNLDVDNLSPREALDLLYDLKSKVDAHDS